MNTKMNKFTAWVSAFMVVAGLAIAGSVAQAPQASAASWIHVNNWSRSGASYGGYFTWGSATTYSNGTYRWCVTGSGTGTVYVNGLGNGSNPSVSFNSSTVTTKCSASRVSPWTGSTNAYTQAGGTAKVRGLILQRYL